MNTAKTIGEQMTERSLHTGGVTGSIPVAPTTQTQTNTGFAASDKGVNAGSAEPSTTLADRYGAGVDDAKVRADLVLMGAIKTALGADTAAEALAKLLTMNRDHGGVMVRWDGDSVSITPADILPTPGGSDE